MPILDRPILAIVDTAASLAAVTTDTNTPVAAVATKKYRVYGLDFSASIAVTGTCHLEVQVAVGGTDVLAGIFIITVDGVAAAQLGHSVHQLRFPEGTYFESGANEAIVVTMQNHTATNTLLELTTTLFYSEVIVG